MRVLVAEPSAPIANALKKFLDGTAEVQVVHFVDEAVQALRAVGPDVVLASVSANFDGEVLCQQVKRLSDATVVLMYPADEVEQAPRRALEAGSDSFLVGPLKKHSVLAVTRLAWRLRVASQRAGKAEAAQRAATQGARAIRASGGINTSDEAFFKKFMLIEVKRSRRYQYPVAVLLVTVEVAGAAEAQLAALRHGALQVIGELLRDVDLAMPFADGKILVFLPHTHRAGSLVVAQRVVERLRQSVAAQATAISVGVASYDPKVEARSQVSFGGLVREASDRLRMARSTTGDQVEGPPHPPRESGPSARKNRISMG